MSNLPQPLSPANVDSFAYVTFKDRLPVILVKIIDSLYRNRHALIKEYGEDTADRIKCITSELSRLRHELTTNKPITYFDKSILGDENMWNMAIDEELKRLQPDDEIYWFKTSFLFGENYLYRRIQDVILKSNLNLDPFRYEKQELLEKGLKIHEFLAEYLHNFSLENIIMDENELKSVFNVFLKMSLWGNEADLSLSINDDDSKLKLQHPKSIVEENSAKLLVDNSNDVFNVLYERRMNEIPTEITIFLDNSGSELLADLHLVIFLISSKLCGKVHLIGKPFPWYVSDVTEFDLINCITHLSTNSNADLSWLGNQIKIYQTKNLIDFTANFFITSPYPFCKMEQVDSVLYRQLSQSALVIFKGDLNYRKLTSDLNWWPPYNVSFQESLLGFQPTNLVALRVLKCDVQVGLTREKYDFASSNSEVDRKWMFASKFGVVQASLLR